MKIYGPYLRNDNRLHLVIKKEDGKLTSISYPKWIMEQHLERKLTSNETVDHIDNDPLNNDLSNLQILTREDNAKKAIKPAEYVELTCKYCGKSFSRRKSWETYLRNHNHDGPFCSKKCSGKLHN